MKERKLYLEIYRKPEILNLKLVIFSMIIKLKNNIILRIHIKVFFLKSN